MTSEETQSSDHQSKREPHAPGPLSVRARMTRDRSRLAAAVDAIGQSLAQPWFLLVLVTLHVLWIVVNATGLFGLPRWDPYPFTLLATIASIEGPLISLLVLMRQHRDSRIQEVREELDLVLSIRQNHRMLATVRLLDSVCRRVDAERRLSDEEMKQLLRSPDPVELLEQLRKQLQESEGSED